MENWKEKFDTHFFGTDRSPNKSIENEAVYVYAVKHFIQTEIIEKLNSEIEQLPQLPMDGTYWIDVERIKQVMAKWLK